MRTELLDERFNVVTKGLRREFLDEVTTRTGIPPCWAGFVLSSVSAAEEMSALLFGSITRIASLLTSTARTGVAGFHRPT
ncbi:MAG TPA: hypothetical protein VE666_18900 [Mycobacterium sp.]|nr:hypothetical protein [Mycobacterium sp.]